MKTNRKEKKIISGDCTKQEEVVFHELKLDFLHTYMIECTRS